MAQSFIDHVSIYARSGNGGAGSLHFRREKHVPKGGPDGGDGGRGGHIIMKGNSQLWTLLHLRYKKHIYSNNGENGGKQRSTGADGKDVVIEVPLGICIIDAVTKTQIGEITKHNETQIVAKGGKGGLGNWHFKSATRQTPRYAQPGLPGEEKHIILELKILADVGLIGYPSAGKSTLLSVVSAAKPKIAEYHFTTLTPNLGIVSYRDDTSFVMGDMPGIIEGAAEGKGLGIRFLRHIERNTALLFVIPCNADDIIKQYKTLNNELKKYNPTMLDKSRIIGISKCDLFDKQMLDALKVSLSDALPNDIPVCYFSSVTQQNITVLKDTIWKTLTK